MTDFQHSTDCPKKDSASWRHKTYPCSEPNECDFEYVNLLLGENARLRKALERVLNSEVVKNAPFAGYSEALSDARAALEGKEQ